MQLKQQREIERRKYHDIAYRHPDYRMGDRRKATAEHNLRSVFQRIESPSYLDVSTGRAEMLDFAESLGAARVQGTEVVDYLLNPPRIIYADAWALPFDDGEFDVVTCLDVIEHILPEDEQRTLLELNRVAKSFVLITANNRPSKAMGVELHVNRKPYEDWNASMRAAFDGDVEWLDPMGDISETWLISK